MSIERRCPYCNGRAKAKVKQQRNTFGNRITSYRVRCGCGLSAPWIDSLEKAEELWNKLDVGEIYIQPHKNPLTTYTRCPKCEREIHIAYFDNDTNTYHCKCGKTLKLRS